MTAKLKQPLDGRTLYILVDGGPALDDFADLVQRLVFAGAPVLQLRDKKLDDRRLVARARGLRELTRGTSTLFIMNDRPDIAVLAEADGVHVGQEELSVADARQIVGPERLVGVSTHSVRQALAAQRQRADYVGVGPVFPSTTKEFDRFTGVDLLDQLSGQIAIPAFAIGGITIDNVRHVLDAGFRRIAVGGAVTSAAEPEDAVRRLLAALATSAS